jgi:hypothetical protein
VRKNPRNAANRSIHPESRIELPIDTSAARFIARSGNPVIEKPFLPDDIRQVVELLIESSAV